MNINITHTFLISLLSVCVALSLCLYKKYNKHIYLEALEELNGIYKVSSPYECVSILASSLINGAFIVCKHICCYLAMIAFMCVSLSILFVCLVLIILFTLIEQILLYPLDALLILMLILNLIA